MRWLTFIILAFVALALQSCVAPRLELFGLRPDWLLVITVFVALYAARKDAILAGWLLGLAADLMTLERVGLLSLTYALVAGLVVAVREYIFRYQAATQFVVTLCAAGLAQAAWGLYRVSLYGAADWSMGEALLQITGGALYTALWAPLIDQALLRTGSLFGFARPKYSYLGLHQPWGSRV